VLESQGKQERTILTHGGGEAHLSRGYARCPALRGRSSLPR
jgi:hypothetical protein